MLRDNGYLPLYSAADTDVPAGGDLSFDDIFLRMLRMLDGEFRANPQHGSLPDTVIGRVMDRFRKVTRIQEQEIERALSYAGEVGLGITTPFARLLVGLNALRKSTGEECEEIRYLKEAARLCAALLAWGAVCASIDDADEARRHCGRALGLYRAVGERLGEANTLKAIGEVRASRTHTTRRSACARRNCSPRSAWATARNSTGGRRKRVRTPEGAWAMDAARGAGRSDPAPTSAGGGASGRWGAGYRPGRGAGRPRPYDTLSSCHLVILSRTA